jgi:hypothetical protein
MVETLFTILLISYVAPFNRLYCFMHILYYVQFYRSTSNKVSLSSDANKIKLSTMF